MNKAQLHIELVLRKIIYAIARAIASEMKNAFMLDEDRATKVNK